MLCVYYVFTFTFFGNSTALHSTAPQWLDGQGLAMPKCKQLLEFKIPTCEYAGNVIKLSCLSVKLEAVHSAVSLLTTYKVRRKKKRGYICAHTYVSTWNGHTASNVACLLAKIQHFFMSQTAAHHKQMSTDMTCSARTGRRLSDDTG